MMKFEPQWKDARQYRKLYHGLKIRPNSGPRYVGDLSKILTENKIQSVWDYGCGVNALLIKLIKKKHPDVQITGYDPAILDSKELIQNYITDEPVEMIVSTDCLEHLRKEELEECFEYWKRKNPKYIFIGTVSTPARKLLPNQTNAHKTIKPKIWWINFVQSHFPSYILNEKYSIDMNNHRFVLLFEKPQQQ